MDEIAKGLWISNIGDARTKSVGADAVITVCQEEISDNVSDDVDYTWFNMSDGMDNYGGTCSYEIFEDAADTLLHNYIKYDTVLIHCHMGRSRSASVAMAVIGVLEDISYEAAYDYVIQTRPQVNPNKTLIEYAKRYIEENGASIF